MLSSALVGVLKSCTQAPTANGEGRVDARSGFMILNRSDSSSRAGAPEIGTASYDDTSAATGVEGSCAGNLGASRCGARCVSPILGDGRV